MAKRLLVVLLRRIFILTYGRGAPLFGPNKVKGPRFDKTLQTDHPHRPTTALMGRPSYRDLKDGPGPIMVSDTLALLCISIIVSELKQGSGPEGDEVL